MKKNNIVLTRKQRQELNEKDAMVKWYLELAIAACLGAAVALGFVVAHQMLTTQWTW
jgi:predicted Co/Zn/Cd cation transporter (cation efflux family)